MKSALELGSFLLVGEKFIPVQECSQRVKDPRYVEGAIVLTVNGTELIGLDLFDLVDQLWIYIINKLPVFVETGFLETYFPDQPVRLTFQANPSKTHVEIVVEEIRIRRGRIPYNEFLSALIKESQAFFCKMLQLKPERSTEYGQALRDVSNLSKNLRHP